MTNRTDRAPLGREFLAAGQALAAMQGGRRLPDAIDAAALDLRLQGASRAALQSFVFGAARQMGWCKAISRQLNRRSPAPPLLALQQVVLAQWAPSEPIAPTSTTALPLSSSAASAVESDAMRQRADAVIVDQAVRAARLLGGDPAAAFINATLRRFLRERLVLEAHAQQDLEARWNFPAWWLECLQRDHPKQWTQIVTSGNRQSPLILRVNRRRTDVGIVLERLRAKGWPAERIEGDAIQLPRSADVTRLPGFAEGLFSVQDYGAQLAARWLDVQPGQRVLDACAAPGGKTAHLLELVDCDLLAVDVDAARLQRVDDNLRRLGLAERTASRRVSLQAADVAQPAEWWDGLPFDRILLDAPCSASGIVSRHPDIRWLRRRSDLATLSRIQSQMLSALWSLLKPGGKLLYAICSVFRAEGEGVASSFLAAHPEAVALPLGAVEIASDGQGESRGSASLGRTLLPGVPFELDAASEPIRDHDGFYYCLLQKSL